MNNKNGRGGCGACPRTDSKGGTDRWERVDFSGKLTSRNSTGNLSEALQVILHQNRSKRKLGFNTVECSPPPASGRLTERNHTPTKQQQTKKLPQTNHKSPLEAILKEMKHKYTESKCKIGKHDNARLAYICLQPSCKMSRMGCAHCFVELHDGHRKSKCDDFLRGFTHDYLDYLSNFGELLQSIATIKRKHEENLMMELNHLRENFDLNMEKLERTLKSQLRERLHSVTSPYQQVLEQSTEYMNHMVETEHPRMVNLSFSERLNSLVRMEYASLNQSLKASLADLQQVHNQDIAFELRAQIHHINSEINELCFMELQPSKSLKGQSTKAYEGMRVDSERKIHLLEDTSVEYEPDHFPKLDYSDTYRKCPTTNKHYLYSKQHSNIAPNFDYVNTLTLFPCCSSKHCCSYCHDAQEGHQAYEQTRSQRVCSACSRAFEVPYGQGIPINCKACSYGKATA